MSGGWNGSSVPNWRTLLVKFFLIALALLIAWAPFSHAYLWLLYAVGQPAFLLPDWSVQVIMEQGALKFLVPLPTGNPLHFTVGDIEEVFLNIVLLIALYGAVFRRPAGGWMRSFAISGLALLCVHALLLILYAATSLPNLLATSGIPGGIEAAATIQHALPGPIMALAQPLLFHWHAWGWDVLPLLLWLPVSGLGAIYKSYRGAT
jgi:hypothetical protein